MGGIIICVAAMATASNSVDVGFDIENKNSGTLKVTAEKGGLGFDVNIAASTSSADCSAQLAATTITDPNSADVSSSCSSHCSNAVQSGEHWMAKNDPPLRDMCHFFPATQPGSLDKIQGDYAINSNAPIWVVDSGEEIGEAVGGILAAGAIMIVGIIIIVVGLIMCCVGCCCLCMGEKS